MKVYKDPREYSEKEEQEFLEKNILEGMVTAVHYCDSGGYVLEFDGKYKMLIPPSGRITWLHRKSSRGEYMEIKSEQLMRMLEDAKEEGRTEAMFDNAEVLSERDECEKSDVTSLQKNIVVGFKSGQVIKVEGTVVMENGDRRQFVMYADQIEGMQAVCAFAKVSCCFVRKGREKE